MNDTMNCRVDRINELLVNEEFQVIFHTYFKENQNVEGIIISGGKLNCMPFVDFRHEIWNKSDTEIIDFLKDIYKKNNMDLDVTTVTSMEYILENVFPKLYSRDYIPELVKNRIAYVPFLDMAIIFYVSLGKDANKFSSYKLTKDLIDERNIDMDKLLTSAKKNIEEECSIQTIQELLNQMQTEELSAESSDSPTMLVLSNSFKLNGSGAMISESVLKKVSKILGDAFAILPSSIHECICLPYKENEELNLFLRMVKDINYKYVLPEEKLTDNVYIWDNGSIRQMV